MIHQHFKLVDVFSAAENIVLGLDDGKYDLKSSTEQIKKISEQYGFELDPQKKIYTMSVSEKQTVEIIKVLYAAQIFLYLMSLRPCLHLKKPKNCLIFAPYAR